MNHRAFVVAGAFATQFAIIGVLFSLGLFVNVFELEFGWSRTLFSSASALAMFMMGTIAIVGGKLSDKFGPRLVLSVSGILFGLGLAGLSLISEPWHFFLFMGTLIAIGLGTHDVVTLSTVAHWYDKRRGMMTAVVKVGTALGQVIVPLIVAALIAGVGWRKTLLIVGVGAACVLFSAAMLMRYPAEGEGASSILGKAVSGLGLSEAKKSRTFMAMCLIQFLFFATMVAIPLHLAPHGMDMGLSTAQAATLLSIVGGSSILGRLGVGILIDKIGCRNAMSICLFLLICALVSFSLANNHLSLGVITVLYGFAHGALFVVVSPMVAFYFGMRAHGELFGIVLFFGTIGGAIGPIAMGATFDSLGSYTFAFLALAIFALVALILVRSLPKESQITA